MKSDNLTPRVSVIVPCRNERDHIGRFLDEVVAQLPVDGGMEVIIADGASEDGTQEILTGRCAADSRIRWVENRGRIVSTGLNSAVRQAQGEFVVRMDVHTRYANDYVYRCVEALLVTGADNVGGPWVASGTGYIQRAIALAFNSPFASGGARSHDVEYEGLVDSVYLGCWRREYLLRIGLFDETLVRNQDDELNLRIVRNGGAVWQSAKIRSWYSPRRTIKGLFKQYLQYGYWKLGVIEKHRIPASIRHVAPAIFCISLFLSAVGVFFSQSILWFLVLQIATYCLVSVCASAWVCFRRTHWVLFPAMPLIFSAFHFGYGIGSLAGIWNFLILRRRNHAGFEGLTR